MIDEKRAEIRTYNMEQRHISLLVARNFVQLRNYLVAELSKDGQSNSRKINQVIERSMAILKQEVAERVDALTAKIVLDAVAQQAIAIYDELTTEDIEHFKAGMEETKEERAQKEGESVARYAVTLLSLRKIAQRKRKKQGMTLTVARNIAADERGLATIAREAGKASGNINKKLEMALDTHSYSMQQTAKKIATEQAELVRLQKVGMDTERIKVLQQRTTQKAIKETLQREAQIGLVDAQGKRWKVGHYVQTTLKSDLNDAYLAGVSSIARNYGSDLAVISSHNAKDDCRKWEGVVVSLNGETPGYLTLGDAKRSKEIFHKNCQHSVHLIRNEKLLHADDLRKHRVNEANIKKRLK